PGARHAYATTLLQTLDFLAESRPALPLGASGIDYVAYLRRRLTMIMTGTSRPGLTGAARWGLLVVALVLLLSFEIRADPQGASKTSQGGPPKAEGRALNRELQINDLFARAVQERGKLKSWSCTIKGSDPEVGRAETLNGPFEFKLVSDGKSVRFTRKQNNRLYR